MTAIPLVFFATAFWADSAVSLSVASALEAVRRKLASPGAAPPS